MNQILIRTAQPGDETQLARVHIQAWQEAYAGLISQVYLRQLSEELDSRISMWKNILANPKRWAWVAEIQNQIVGFVLFGPPRDSNRDGYIELGAIYLLASEKNKKIGFNLLYTGFNFMRNLGYQKAYCWVLENNPTIAFYERTGAKFSAQIKQDEIGGENFNELAYEWDSLVLFDSEIKFPKFTFDENLKEIPDDVAQWQLYVVELKSKLEKESDLEDKLKFFEYIGVAQRILKNYDEAKAFLQNAVTASYSHPKASRLIQNFIRLAHVYQWTQEFKQAHMLFEQAKSLMNEKPMSDSLRASFHQHYGKLYFDQKQFDLAKVEFARALEIRKSIGAPQDQVDSSQFALDEVIKRLQFIERN